MSVEIHEQTRRRPKSGISVRSALATAKVLKAGVNVCVWKRTMPESMATWLRDLAQTLVHEESRAIARSADVRELVEALPACAQRAELEKDIEQLVGIWTSLAKTPTVQASIATVETNKCRRFHADYKPLRLVCTYAGPGTEWVDDADAVRGALGVEGVQFDVANAHIVPRAARIQRARPGDVVLLKGELFAGNAGRGAVHRSPPIEQSGERRLVLTLDSP